ncbi:MAG: hypothetical protein FD135_1056 [Comamonadaceae bacterium]|nr:MAG: hypothetical protein FD135_1056 [Comamonadaceae bacterium]
MNPSSLQTSFPKWFSLSKLDDRLWEGSCDFGVEPLFVRLLHLIGEEQAVALQVSRENLYRVSSAMVEDFLVFQKSAISDERINFQYLQFEASAFPLHVAIEHGEAGIAFDWIHNAVGDCVSAEYVREFNIARVGDLLSTATGWIAASRQLCFQQWFPNFYYYCRNWAALYEVANSLIPHTLLILDRPWPHTESAVRTIVFTLNWATGNSHSSERILAELAMKIFNNPALPVPLQAQIATCFLTHAARFTPKTAEDWARWALDNVSAELTPSGKLQTLIATIATAADWDAQHPAVLQAIDIYINTLRALFLQPAAFVQRIEQSVKMLNFLIYKLHAFGRSNALLEVMCRWYAVPEGTRRHGSVLFCMSNHSDGMAYLGLRAHLIPFASSKAIETLSQETSRALGMALTLQGQRELYPVETRRGMPDYALAPEFEQVLSNHYRWPELDHAECTAARAAVFLPGYPHPLQALMQAGTGRCLPISSSLQEPLPDRVIRRAAIWFSGEDNYSEMEAEAVVALLDAAGIHCDRMSGREHTKADFLDIYRNSDYDLLWVAGHGQCDRWAPTTPTILAGAGDGIGIDELLALQVEANAEGRRFLILNICDSGAAGVFGGMHKLGLAPMLASRAQAVVGHLWPVDPLVAAGFGVMLSHELAHTPGDFFAAYERTLAAMHAPWHTFIEQVAGVLDCQIFERMRNTERNLDNIFHRGSSCFFE